MEHDGDDDYKDILSGADEAQGEPDFEAYLRNKVDECTKPPSELPIRNVPVVAAEDTSSKELDLEVDENGESSAFRSAKDADEKLPILVKHEHPIVGSYITEKLESVQYDHEWVEIYDAVQKNPEKWRDIALTKVVKPLFDNPDTDFDVLKFGTADVIKHINKMERAFFMLKAVQNGLWASKEQFLLAETRENRIALLELDRKERAKVHKVRVKGERGVGSGKAKVSTKGKSVAQKSIDTFVIMGYDRAYILDKMVAKNENTESNIAYLDAALAKRTA